MAKSKVVRVSEHLWGMLEEKAFSTFGLKGQEMAMLSLLLQGNPATSGANPVKVVAAKNTIKDKRQNDIIYMYDVHKEQYDWCTGKVDCRDFLEILYKPMIKLKPELQDLLNKVTWCWKRDPNPEEMGPIQHAAEELDRYRRIWIANKKLAIPEGESDEQQEG